MTRDEARQLIPIMQAYVDGSSIQVRSRIGTLWVDVSAPEFRSFNEYRVKPKELPPAQALFTITDAYGQEVVRTSFREVCEREYLQLCVTGKGGPYKRHEYAEVIQ